MASTRFGIIVNSYRGVAPADYSGDFSSLQSALDSEITARETLGTTVSGYGTRIGTLETEMDAVQADVVTAQNAADAANVAISENALSDEQSDAIYEAFINSKTPIITQLQSDVTSLEGRVSVAEDTIVSYEEEFVGIAAEFAQVEANFDSMKDAGQLS